jgi:hypothetical protein
MLFDSFADDFRIATNCVSIPGFCLVYDPFCHVAMNFRQKKFGLCGGHMLWIGPPPFCHFPPSKLTTCVCNCS